MIKKFLACIALIAGLQTSYAQEKPLNYWGRLPAMMNEQASLLFKQADRVLSKHRPTVQPNDERKLALYALDAILHDTRLDNGLAFREYMNKNISQITQKLQQTRPQFGLKIYKLYNQAFIVQSPSITIAFDLIKGGKKDSSYFSDELMEKLVSQCDVLFISHKHGDHADESVAALFASQKKMVVAPNDALIGKSQYYKLTQPDTKIDFDLAVNSKLSIPVTIFPGHQDDVTNNLYVVTTPEGKSVMHTGDQYKKEDLPMLTSINKLAKVDVLLLHCWIHNPEEVVAGVAPQLVVTGHENEMAHKINNREPYWLTFRRMQKVSKPVVIMAWGEYFHFTK